MDVLVIHPDQKLVSELTLLLKRDNWTVWSASTVSEAISILREAPIAIVVADWDFVKGQDLPSHCEGKDYYPIILLVSGSLQEGLRLGPLSSLRSLNPLVGIVARIRSALQAADHPIQVGEMLIDPLRKQVRFREKWIKFPPLQFQILHYLAQNAGRVVDYRELLHHIWGYETDNLEAREPLKSQIRLIRRRLGLSAHEPQYLESMRGFGYSLVDPKSSQES